MNNKKKTTVTIESGKQDVLAVREFDAPRTLVFKALTDPKLYGEWIGPRELTTEIVQFEARSGGSWSFFQTDPAGQRYDFHGIFHDVTAPERIIGTFEFNGLPEKGHVILEKTILEELPGSRTRLINLSVFQTIADRDGMVTDGMERGIIESYEQLDELLEQIQNPMAGEQQ